LFGGAWITEPPTRRTAERFEGGRGGSAQSQGSLGRPGPDPGGVV